MLQLSHNLLNRPILSLRTGGIVGTTTAAIINPTNLKIEGFYCQDGFSRKKTVVLVSQDIRDVIEQGVVVNDHDVLVDSDELVRLKQWIDLGFELGGKQVITASKEKLGKVTDYATDTSSMYIQKLYVGQSILKSLAGGTLSIDRTQIIEVNDRKITVQDLAQLTPAGAKAWA
jgi:uncharacterized protein YrrD